MRIAQIIASDAWGGVGPEKLEEGIGGREGAMIRLAREWARAGHQVTNFVPTQDGVRHDEGEGYHEYVPVGMSTACLANIDYDACVAWECPSVFNHMKITDRQPVRLTEMQCAHFYSDEEQYAAGAVGTGVVALSEWARDFLVHDGLEIDEDRLHVLPNCVDLEFYPEMDAEKKLDGKLKLFYSSSPDRGLVHMLRLWPNIRNARPDAELYVGYGAKNWTQQMVWSHNRIGEVALEIYKGLQHPGVVDLGVIGQRDLARIQRECHAWIYPCDPLQPTETGCITAIEAMAAYCPAIISDADCLEEEFGEVARVIPLPFNETEYAQAISETFVPETWVEMAAKGRRFAEGRQWKDVADRWIDLFVTENARA